MRRMRWLLCGVAMMGMLQGAKAADLADSFLRGSAAIINVPGAARWDGIYFGGQVGATYSGADFSSATKDLVGTILRESTLISIANVSDWHVLGKADTSGTSFGGFIGYNTTWDGAVIGAELNYNRTNMSMAVSDTIALVPGGFPDGVLINASASTRITDYGTARVRGGWAAGNFMPYGFVGVAIGRADTSRSATVSLFRPPSSPLPYFVDTRSDNQTGAFAYGYAIGLGLDVALMSNFFVRGEYEYVKFGDFNQINLHIHTARVAAGLKF